MENKEIDAKVFFISIFTHLFCIFFMYPLYIYVSIYSLYLLTNIVQRQWDYCSLIRIEIHSNFIRTWFRYCFKIL